MKKNQTTALRSIPAKILLACCLALPLAGLSGCLAVAVGAGAGAVAYLRGDLQANLDADLDRGVVATRKAISDLEFVKVSESKDALTADFVARTALDQKIEITLTNSGRGLTKIKIRVGLVGDQQLSLAILDKIKADL